MANRNKLDSGEFREKAKEIGEARRLVAEKTIALQEKLTSLKAQANVLNRKRKKN